MDVPFSSKTLETQTEFLRNLARSLLADEHQAEDLAQSVALGVLQGPEQSLRSPRGWLATVLRRRAANMVRDEATHAYQERQAAQAEEAPDGSRALEHLELQERVVQAVRALDEKYRQVIDLRFYEGLGPQAIARSLELPVSTVKTRLQRALACLRTELDGTSDGDRNAWCMALAPLIGARWVPGKGALPLAAPLTVSAWIMGLKTLSAAVVVALGVWGWVAWSGSGATSSPEVSREELAGALAASPVQPSRGAAIEQSRGQRSVVAPQPELPAPMQLVPAWSIEGHVRDARGAPVTQARVSLIFTNPVRCEAHETPIVTDAQGRYSFLLELPKLSISSRAMRRFELAARVDAGTQPAAWASLSLPEPQARETLPVILDVRLPEVVRCARGRVVNADGEPVSGAQVALSGPDGTRLQTARTLEDGSYSLPLPADTERAYVSAWHPSGGLGCSLLQTLAGNEHTLPDLQLRRGASVSGTLRYPGGNPIAGLRVRCSRPEEDTPEVLSDTWFMGRGQLQPPVHEQAGMSAGGGETDEQGRFRIDGLLAGSYVLWMKDRDLQGGVQAPIGRLNTGEEFEATLPLHLLRIRIEDSRGLPLPGADVEILGPNGAGAMATRARGVEALVEQWVAPGELTIHALFKGAPGEECLVMIGEADHETLITLQLDFERGTGRIQVKAMDQRGATLSLSSILLFEEHNGERTRFLSRLSIDSEGLSEPVVAGAYGYRINVDPWDMGRGFTLDAEGQVEVRDGQLTPLAVTLELAGRLQVRCELQDDDHQAIRLFAARLDGGAELEPLLLLLPIDDAVEVGPLHAGETKVSELLEAGNWSVELRADGYTPFQTIVRLRAGELTPLKAALLLADEDD